MTFIDDWMRIVCKKLNISMLCRTSVGIKGYNSLNRSGRHQVLEQKAISVDALYLGFDGLDDKHTLLGVPLCISPHYGLMEALRDKKNPMECDYLFRYRNGTLDMRWPVSKKEVSAIPFPQIFVKKRSELESGVYTPIEVYECAGRFYIADGKHRAAMSAVLYPERSIACNVISNDYLRDSYRQWVYSLMKQHPKKFTKHIELMESVK